MPPELGFTFNSGFWPHSNTQQQRMRTLHDHESCFHFFHVCPFQIRHIEFDWGVRITKYIPTLLFLCIQRFKREWNCDPPNLEHQSFVNKNSNKNKENGILVQRSVSAESCGERIVV